MAHCVQLPKAKNTLPFWGTVYEKLPGQPWTQKVIWTRLVWRKRLGLPQVIKPLKTNDLLKQTHHMWLPQVINPSIGRLFFRVRLSACLRVVFLRSLQSLVPKKKRLNIWLPHAINPKTSSCLTKVKNKSTSDFLAPSLDPPPLPRIFRPFWGSEVLLAPGHPPRRAPAHGALGLDVSPEAGGEGVGPAAQGGPSAGVGAPLPPENQTDLGDCFLPLRSSSHW